jgi:hypothetical protein
LNSYYELGNIASASNTIVSRISSRHGLHGVYSSANYGTFLSINCVLTAGEKSWNLYCYGKSSQILVIYEEKVLKQNS